MNFLHLPVGTKFKLKRENDGTIYTKVNENKQGNAIYPLAFGKTAHVTIHGCSQIVVVDNDMLEKDLLNETKDFDLKIWRERRHLTRKELSDKSGVHEQTIEKLESGENNPYQAKISTLIKLATALNCKVKDFYPCEKVI